MANPKPVQRRKYGFSTVISGLGERYDPREEILYQVGEALRLILHSADKYDAELDWDTFDLHIYFDDYEEETVLRASMIGKVYDV